MIYTKSAFDPKRAEDGFRILIEPEWPRGLAKGKSVDAEWMSGLFPSRNLRDWMQRNLRKTEGFRDRYLLELAHNERAIAKVCEMHKKRGTVTILTVPIDEPWDIYETLANYLRIVCE